MSGEPGNIVDTRNLARCHSCKRMVAVSDDNKCTSCGALLPIVLPSRRNSLPPGPARAISVAVAIVAVGGGIAFWALGGTTSRDMNGTWTLEPSHTCRVFAQGRVGAPDPSAGDADAERLRVDMTMIQTHQQCEQYLVAHGRRLAFDSEGTVLHEHAEPNSGKLSETINWTRRGRSVTVGEYAGFIEGDFLVLPRLGYFGSDGYFLRTKDSHVPAGSAAAP